MTQKYLILIDDNSQRAKLEQIKDTLKSNEGIELFYEEYNPNDFQQRVSEDVVVFNKEAFVEKLNELPYLNRLDSVVCDYHLGDMINGFEIIQIIREVCPNYKKQTILYSTGIDQVIDKIIAGNDFETKKKSIEQLVKCNPEFVSKVGYEQNIIKHIKQQDLFDFEDELIKWFYSRKDDEFNCLFPKYQGMKFEEIARCLEVDSQDSIEFKKELVEQIIAYLSKINGLS